jgi:hypothetical protein
VLSEARGGQAGTFGGVRLGQQHDEDGEHEQAKTQGLEAQQG